MDKLDGQNQAQDDFDSKIEVKKEMKKKGVLEKVEKLDVGDSDSEFSKTEIKDDCKTKLEIKKEVLNEIEFQKGMEIMDQLELPKGSFYSVTCLIHLLYPQTDELDYFPGLEF